MWQLYIDILHEHLPDACLIFDRFHITQQLLKAVDGVQREEAHEHPVTDSARPLRT